MKKTIIAFVVVVVLVVVGVFYFTRNSSKEVVVNPNGNISTTTNNLATTTISTDKTISVIGKSVEGRDIIAYHYGAGVTEVLFVGGIHGGYEWNTVLLAYQLMDSLKANPNTVPTNVKVTVVPVLNPDGLNRVVGTSTRFALSDISNSENVITSGRFNGNNVDLNRNFDCDWQAIGEWQSKTVSGGSAAFSEPESQAIKNYIETSKPKAVVVFYSAAGGIFSSSCHNGVLPETNNLTNAYAKASGYPAFETFDFYATTGDMTNWLAKISIPSISVLLTNHTNVEWTKNFAGIQAVLKYYSK